MRENIINHALQAWQYLDLLYMYKIERAVSMEILNVIHIKVSNGYAVQ